MSHGHPWFVIFFIIGAIIFFSGLIIRFFFYWKGQWDGWALIKGILSTLFSRKILKVIQIIFLDGILQRRLFSQDRLRWLMKVLIMIGYPGILIAGHIKVGMMPQLKEISHLVQFFYAPFCDFYYFRDVINPIMPLSDILFAISFDLFGAMILTGEFIALYRRFFTKGIPFKTSIGDIIAVNLLGGWFILRFFCEATSILSYSLSNSIAKYWFVSFGLSKILAPLKLPWISLNYPLWSISGLFLGALVALIPYNKKLWHILTIPIVMFMNVMPKDSFTPSLKKGILPFSLRDLISIDSCVKCGSCVEICPVYIPEKRLENTMGGLFTPLKSFIRKAYGFPWILLAHSKKIDLPKDFSEPPYLCTLCGRCEFVCPSFIRTKELRIALREYLVENGAVPKNITQLMETLDKFRNIVGEPNEERFAWVQGMKDPPLDLYQKEKAEVVYFVGCVASFFPMTKRIPQAFVQILKRAGVDFTLLGGEEWCCGFPLIAAGMRQKAKSFLQHNLKRVKEKGAQMIIFACPSCYNTWREECGGEVKIFHSTQFLKKLIEEGKITFKKNSIKITYHDPCDLGRASGVYDPPRDILRAIPGVDLIEMEGNRDQCICCGGGGDLEIVNPNLSSTLAQAKIEEIRATGAEMVITACQQCVRTIMANARRKKVPLVVMDIIEFVLKNMENKGQ